MNLVPVVGQLNGMRSNKPFAENVSGKKEQTFNGNGKKLVLTSRVVIPDPSIRGDIARIALYMNQMYRITYSNRQRALFDKWDKDDPLSKDEKARVKKIMMLQK